MKWKKLGQIFNPMDYKLANNCKEFAQSPQTLVFKEFIRVYFSTRERDGQGKYLSHISFVDFGKDFKKILKVSEKPVIELGKLGCFDEHGIFPLNILKTKKNVLGYIGGWSRRVSVSVDGSIGLAYSDNDGISFKRLFDGPILTATVDEPFMVGDPFVIIDNDIYHMWYIYGVRWVKDKEGRSERVYKIGSASSRDGVKWKKAGKQLIKDKLDNNECQALPTVIKIKDKFHMFFCYREAIGFRDNKKRGYRIGYAISNNMVDWTRSDENSGIDLSEDGWDSEMMCYPHVFSYDGRIWMLYNGNEFGRNGFGIAVLEDVTNEY